MARTATYIIPDDPNWEAGDDPELEYEHMRALDEAVDDVLTAVEALDYADADEALAHEEYLIADAHRDARPEIHERYKAARAAMAERESDLDHAAAKLNSVRFSADAGRDAAIEFAQGWFGGRDYQKEIAEREASGW